MSNPSPHTTKPHSAGECLKNLQEVMQEFASAETLAGVLRVALSYLHKHWGFEGVGLQLLDPTEEMLLCFHLVCTPEFQDSEFTNVQQPVRLSQDSSRSAQVIASGQRYYAVVDDVDTHPFVSATDREVSRRLSIHDNLMIPVLHQGVAHAVLHLSTYGKYLNLNEQQLDEVENFCAYFKGYVVAAQKDHLLALHRQRANSTNTLVENLAAATDLPAVLNLIGERITRWTSLDGYSINLLGPDSGDLEIRKIALPEGYQAIEDSYVGFPIHPTEDDPNNEVIKQQNVLIIDAEGIAHYKGSSHLRFERWGLAYLCVLPIVKADGQCLGTIMLFSQKEPIPHGVVGALKKDLQLFSRHLDRSMKLHHFETQADNIKHAIERHKKFLNFVVQLSELHDKDKLIHTFLAGLLEHFPQYQTVVLYVEKHFKLHFTTSVVTDPNYTKLNEQSIEKFSGMTFELSQEDGAVPVCYLQNQQLFVEDLNAIRHLPMAEKDRAYMAAFPQLKSIMQTPVRHKGTPVGVLGMASFDHNIKAAKNDSEIIQLICDYLGGPLFNADMYEKVETQNYKIEQLNRELMGQVNKLNTLASKDELTGLDNVRELRNKMKALAPANGHLGRQFSLIMIDVDHFKDINDHYGHIVGDVMLRLVAKRLVDAARNMDSVYRYGGEEFTVLLPKTNAEEAAQVAERLRERLVGTPFVAEGLSLTISASFGVAEYANEETLDSLITRADKQLYLAKEAGRNCVRWQDS